MIGLVGVGLVACALLGALYLVLKQRAKSVEVEAEFWKIGKFKLKVIEPAPVPEPAPLKRRAGRRR